MTFARPSTSSAGLFSSLSLAALLGCLVPHSASASLVAYDGFEYDIGGGAGLGGKGAAGSGWAGAWTSADGTIVADDMSYSNGSISIDGGGQSVSITSPSSSTYLTRGFDTLGTSSGEDIYFSFLFKLASGGAGSDYLNFWISDDAVRDNSAGIGDLTTSTGTNGVRFGARIFGDETGSSDGEFDSNPSYVAGTTYLLVGRISRDGADGAAADVFDRVELWVDPTSTTLGEAAITVDFSTEIDSSIGMSFIGLRTVNIGSGDDYRFDEFRVGTSAAGVLGVIPEPSSAASLLGGLSLLAVLGRRCRR